MVVKITSRVTTTNIFVRKSDGTIYATLSASKPSILVSEDDWALIKSSAEALDAAGVVEVNEMADEAAVKSPVRAATTGNITLADEQTIDGIAVVAGQRVLVKDQTAGAQNGIYEVASGANWSRAADFAHDWQVKAGMVVFVSEGTANEDTGWEIATDDPIIVGTTAIVFAKVTV